MSKKNEAKLVGDKELHDVFCERILSIVSRNGHQYISKKSLYDFFDSIDEISTEIQEYHDIAIESFVMEDCIPIKSRMVEMHAICSSIYSMEGIHHDTIEHLTNVRDYANRICSYMREDVDYKDFLDDQTVELISMAAFMHDISKLIIKEDFLYDGRRFNSEERLFMNAHPLISSVMIDYIKTKNKYLGKYLDEINIYIVEHHENLDGSGYPAGKISKEISFGGKILRVADTLEAMKAVGRKYKQPIDRQLAINEMLSKTHIYEKSVVMAMSFSIEDSSDIENLLGKHFYAETVAIPT